MARVLWRLWSPTWRFDNVTYDESALSFDNPDVVDVVVHSYCHRYGYASGDPTVDAIEIALAGKPKIQVPTIALCGGGAMAFLHRPRITWILLLSLAHTNALY
jgi:hypothetical protein